MTLRAAPASIVARFGSLQKVGLEPRAAGGQRWQSVAQRTQDDDQVDDEEDPVGDERHGLPVLGQQLFAVLLLHALALVADEGPELVQLEVDLRHHASAATHLLLLQLG